MPESHETRIRVMQEGRVMRKKGKDLILNGHQQLSRATT